MLFSVLAILAAMGVARADCVANAPPAARVFEAVVRGPATEAEVRDGTATAILRTGGKLNPNYVNLPRIVAFFEVGGSRQWTIAAVTDGQMPAPGEAIRIASRHRDPADPCAFIPWTVVGKLRIQTPPPSAIDSGQEISVPIVRRGLNYFVPVKLNDAVTLEFMIDSGASGVVVPQPVIDQLQRSGTLGIQDLGRHGFATLADGTKSPTTLVHLKSVSVGGKTLYNVMAYGGTSGSSLLLGQTFLGRFKSWSIDNARSALVLKM